MQVKKISFFDEDSGIGHIDISYKVNKTGLIAVDCNGYCWKEVKRRLLENHKNWAFYAASFTDTGEIYLKFFTPPFLNTLGLVNSEEKSDISIYRTPTASHSLTIMRLTLELLEFSELE